LRRLLGGGNTFRGDCGEGIWVNSEGGAASQKGGSTPVHAGT
jgi:hypothetical protein